MTVKTFWMLLYLCSEQLCNVQGFPSRPDCEQIWKAVFTKNWSGRLIDGKDHVCISYQTTKDDKPEPPARSPRS